MKKILAAALIAFGLFRLGAEPIDFIVLLDVSESMLPYFDDTVNFLIRDVLDEHLIDGDKFHLLSFADIPEIEIVQTIGEIEDIRKVLGRILLLQPLGQYTDLVGALKFLLTYTTRTAIANEKKILVLTDGDHDPPPGSRYSVERSGETYREVAREIARDIRRAGWDMRIVEFPSGTEPIDNVVSGTDNQQQNGGARDSVIRATDPNTAGQNDGIAVGNAASSSPLSSAEGVPSERSNEGSGGANVNEPADRIASSRTGETEQTDTAIGVPQLDVGSNVTGDGSNATGDGSSTTGDGSSTTGDGSSTTGDGSSTTGDGSSTTGDGSSTTGDGSSTTGDGSNSATSFDGEVAREAAGSDGERFETSGSTRTPGNTDGSSAVSGDGAEAQPIDATRSANGEGPEGDSSSENDLLADFSRSLGVEVVDYDPDSQRLSHIATGAPLIVFPDNLGKVRRRFSIPFTIENFSAEPILVRLSAIKAVGIDILRDLRQITIGAETTRILRAPVRLPETIPLGEQSIAMQLEFSDDLRLYPREGTITLTIIGSGIDTDNLLRVLGFIGLGIVALALLAAVVYFLRNVLTQSVSATGSTPAVRYRQYESSERPIEMIVEGQNRNIGTRNVQVVRDGASKSVGSGSSAFLIFAFPMRHGIAEIRRSGDNYSFIPLKLDYCVPDVEIENCLERDILLRSAVGHIVNVRFRRYISPLERVNQIMHLTDKPGRTRPWD